MGEVSVSQVNIVVVTYYPTHKLINVSPQNMYLLFIKEIVQSRHGQPIKFLFLPKMGLLGSQVGNGKNCWL